MLFRVGIDEVGRGPVAGPVSVGVVVVPFDFEWSQIPGVRDSKQVSAKVRERIYALAKEHPSIVYVVESVSASSIDRGGIVPAIQHALNSALARLRLNPDTCELLLDGGLRAPAEFLNQKTIIRGDASEPVIALASIMAKVERDALLVRLADEYPGYGFEVHKGYGTKAHYQALEKYGLSKEHRRTFLKKIAQ